MQGDRLVTAGRHGPLTGRTRHALLTVPASTAQTVALVAGLPWNSDAAAEIIQGHAGRDARLVADGSPARCDVRTCASPLTGPSKLGYDSRRVRPSIVLSGIAADLGRACPGVRCPSVTRSSALFGTPACVVTTIDPDAGSQDLDVPAYPHGLRGHIGAALPGHPSGLIRVRDEVSIVESDATPAPSAVGSRARPTAPVGGYGNIGRPRA